MDKYPKRPRDPNQLAESIIDIATAKKSDTDPRAGVTSRLREMTDLAEMIEVFEARV